MRSLSVCVLVAALATPLSSTAEPGAKPPEEKSTETAKKAALKLEDLFPEKSFFGPAAGSAAFSADGKYGAYLWRPYPERRHGSDLWILDTATGKNRRVTKVSVLAEFQESTRKVRDDRVKKAKKAPPKKKDDARKGEKKGDELGDQVGEKDADDTKAPRYGGIRSFTWSHQGHELLFSSAGDGYRYDIKKDSITRLTRTRARERSITFTPDDRGYTYRLENSLMIVFFGSHTIEQLDQPLPRDEELAKYAISPNGRRLAFVTKKQLGKPPDPRKVNIVNYRDRFAQVKEVPRQVSDNPHPATEYSVYLYEPEEPLSEEFTLEKVFSTTSSGPRDRLSEPQWAPDSSRVTFATYDQASATVRVFEAVFPEKPKAPPKRNHRREPLRRKHRATMGK